MFKNQIKLAWRNLIKHNVFSFISFFGLTIACTFLIIVVAFTWREYQVNANIKDAGRVCLLQSKWQDPNLGSAFTTLAPLAKALRENYPSLVENYYHHDGISSIVSKGAKHYTEDIQLGDSTFLNMFGFPLLVGNPQTALIKPNSVVITERKALKYFGSSNILGKTLTITSFSGKKQDFTITGVLKDFPFSTVTHFTLSNPYDFFLATSSLAFFGREQGFNSWKNPFIVGYVKLKPGVYTEDLQKAIKTLLKANASLEVRKNLTVTLIPLNQYYLHSNGNSAENRIIELMLIAGFIMLIASINYINLSIGNGLSRLKEIGIRKVLGSLKKQLILQFLAESMLTAFFAVLFSLIFYFLFRSGLANLLGIQLPSLLAFPLWFIIVPIIIILILGTLSGIFPAYIISSQHTIESLKGKFKAGTGSTTFRHSMIIVQFVVSIVIFVSAIVIDKQISFFFQSDLGYAQDHVLTFAVPRDWSLKGVQHMEMARNQLVNLPHVINATFSYEIPDGRSGNTNNKLYLTSRDSSKAITATSLITDENYIGTYKIPILAGHFFSSRGFGADSLKITLNQSAVAALGFHNEKDAIGNKVRLQGSNQVFSIGGVIKDFHFGSLSQRIDPIFFVHVNLGKNYRYMSIRIQSGNESATIQSIQNKWERLFPDAPFEYALLDTSLLKMYQSEIQMRKASQAATVLALVLVLLGVLGMVTYAINKRLKEMSIRKVIGASEFQVVNLFLNEFTRSLVISILIAWPLAYFIMQSWLQNYVYRIRLSFLPFLEVGISMITLITLVIIAKTWKIAVSNPITGLRNE